MMVKTTLLLRVDGGIFAVYGCELHSSRRRVRRYSELFWEKS